MAAPFLLARADLGCECGRAWCSCADLPRDHETRRFNRVARSRGPPRGKLAGGEEAYGRTIGMPEERLISLRIASVAFGRTARRERPSPQTDRSPVRGQLARIDGGFHLAILRMVHRIARWFIVNRVQRSPRYHIGSGPPRYRRIHRSSGRSPRRSPASKKMRLGVIKALLPASKAAYSVPGQRALSSSGGAGRVVAEQKSKTEVAQCPRKTKRANSAKSVNLMTS